MALGIVTAHVEGRPDHLPIPLDTMHEFLKEPLPRTHPILCAWIESFALGRVRFALVKVDAGRFMLYTHRVHSCHASRSSRWCCS